MRTHSTTVLMPGGDSDGWTPIDATWVRTLDPLTVKMMLSVIGNDLTVDWDIPVPVLAALSRGETYGLEWISTAPHVIPNTGRLILDGVDSVGERMIVPFLVRNSDAADVLVELGIDEESAFQAVFARMMDGIVSDLKSSPSVDLG